MTWKSAVAEKIAVLLARGLRWGGPGLASHVISRLSDELRPARWEHLGLNIRIHAPPYTEPDARDRELVERIFEAYRHAKRDQDRQPARFRPSSLWQKQLDRAYRPLNEALRTGDPGTAHHFLANFGAWDQYTGIEHTNLVRQYAKSAAGRAFFEKNLTVRMLGAWLDFESEGRPIDALSLPNVGNQYGAVVNGRFVSLNAVFDDVYSRMAARWLPGGRPVIAELGAGYGRFLHALANCIGGDFRYLDFDLPETLCCAAFYLMKVFPEKTFLMYGEEPFNGEALNRYDFILLPSWEIQSLPDRSVDLFLNRCSLGEMTPEAAGGFVRTIARTADCFWHLNHELQRNEFEDGSASLVNREYPVPEEDFELLARAFDSWAVLDLLSPDRWDGYWYLYRRRPS